MIISMPIVRLAPGVSSMSSRVISVVGVTESEEDSEVASPLTTIVCAAGATESRM